MTQNTLEFLTEIATLVLLGVALNAVVYMAVEGFKRKRKNGNKN